MDDLFRNISMNVETQPPAAGSQWSVSVPHTPNPFITPTIKVPTRAQTTALQRLHARAIKAAIAMTMPNIPNITQSLSSSRLPFLGGAFGVRLLCKSLWAPKAGKPSDNRISYAENEHGAPPCLFRFGYVGYN